MGGVTHERDLPVGDLSEGAILRRILDVLGPSSALVGPGDDAAVVGLLDRRVVVTTDTLVHGPDFRLAWSSGGDLGYKAAAVNLADIAAMGARPVALVVALAMPNAMRLGFVEDLAAGLRDACRDLAPGCTVAGGDLTASDTLTIAVTALGALEGEPVLRSGARAGDVVTLAGGLGAAARGLEVLFARFRDEDGEAVPVRAGELTDGERSDVAAQLRPRPPVALGPVAAATGATAMMDVSDGLLLDATRMADASGVTIDLHDGLDRFELAGGEDHGLLTCFGPAAPLPEGFRVIGRVVPRGADAVTVGGHTPRGPAGWDPYRDWDAHRG